MRRHPRRAHERVSVPSRCPTGQGYEDATDGIDRRSWRRGVRAEVDPGQLIQHRLELSRSGSWQHHALPRYQPEPLPFCLGACCQGRGDLHESFGLVAVWVASKVQANPERLRSVALILPHDGGGEASGRAPVDVLGIVSHPIGAQSTVVTPSPRRTGQGQAAGSVPSSARKRCPHHAIVAGPDHEFSGEFDVPFLDEQPERERGADGERTQRVEASSHEAVSRLSGGLSTRAYANEERRLLEAGLLELDGHAGKPSLPVGNVVDQPHVLAYGDPTRGSTLDLQAADRLLGQPAAHGD